MGSETPLDLANETADNTPEAAAENTPVAEEANTTASTSATSGFDALEPKMKLHGVVKRVELQGAVVEVDGGHKGLLHISQISTEPVKNVADVLKEGQEVTVYVLAIDKKKIRLDLTMVQPPAVTWNELKVGERYSGTVVRLENFGAFIDVGAERPGLIHVSELAAGYVSNPSDVVKVGDQVEARLIGVNRRKKQLDFSIKALEQEENKAAQAAATIEDEQEELPTAMELALRAALGNDSALLSDANKKREKKRDNRKKGRTPQQNDIIARTLRMHDNS